LPFIIKENEKYFQIKWSGAITETSVIDCSKSIATFSDYPQKNRIYDLRDATFEISGFSLAGIANFTQLVYPMDAKQSKAAIVVSPGLQKAIVEIFKDYESKLPYQIKIFYDQESAEEWAMNEKE